MGSSYNSELPLSEVLKRLGFRSESSGKNYRHHIIDGRTNQCVFTGTAG